MLNTKYVSATDLALDGKSGKKQSPCSHAAFILTRRERRYICKLINALHFRCALEKCKQRVAIMGGVVNLKDESEKAFLIKGHIKWMIRSGFGNREARWLQRLSMCRNDGQLVCLDVGLIASGLQALYLPSLKNKERACIQWQRHGWFNGWAHLICVKQAPGTTPLCVWQMVGRTWPWSLLLGRGVSNYKRNWWLMSAWLVGY